MPILLWLLGVPLSIILLDAVRRRLVLTSPTTTSGRERVRAVACPPRIGHARRAHYKVGAWPIFEAAGLAKSARPLADRLRPATLSAVVGQDHLVGPEGSLTRMLQAGRVPSMILWGPPGCGKTTIARLLAHETALEFEQLSAIFSGVQDLRKAFDRAKIRREEGRGTLLFIDEIHRFNRAQQDSFLPHGGRHDHARRRHHREPLLRAQRRAPVARRRARVRASR